MDSISAESRAAQPRLAGARPLPTGRLPTIGVGEIVAALHRRRERRRVAVADLKDALLHLDDAVRRHLKRIAAVRAVVEAQGGSLAHLQHYDGMMARLRAELRQAEKAMAVVFGAAAHGSGIEA